MEGGAWWPKNSHVRLSCYYWRKTGQPHYGCRGWLLLVGGRGASGTRGVGGNANNRVSVVRWPEKWPGSVDLPVENPQGMIGSESLGVVLRAFLAELKQNKDMLLYWSCPCIN